jgi:hypothetical protein
MDRQHDIMIESADGRPKLRAPHCLWSVDSDLRRDLQAVFIGWRDIDPHHGRVLKAAGQWQHNDSRERIEPVGLDDHGGTRFTAIPLQGDDDNVAAACQPRSSQASALTRSQNSVSVRPTLVRSASAMASHWRRQSAAKPGERVSGTQIWTGRRPAARILSRRRLTRSALVGLSIRYM